MEEGSIRVPRTARYHLLGEADTARALWVVLHGYGQLARYFLRNFEGLKNDLLIVAPEGLSRFYTDIGHTRVGATWMTREDRTHEIADQISYLDLLADTVLRSCPPGTPLHVLGFSQGVATACRWLGLGRAHAQRLVLWGGSLPPDLPVNAWTVQLVTTHVELVHGIKDTLVPGSVVASSEALLRDAGILHETHRFDGGHELDPFLLKRLITA